MNNPFFLLQTIINQDQPDSGLPLLEDSQLVLLVHAWSKIRVNWDPPDELAETPESDYDLWELLWEFCFWSMEDLSLAAGISESTAMRCFARAKINRLIYPNGEISSSSRRIIALIIGSELGKMADKAGGISTKTEKVKGKKSGEDYDGDA